MWECKGLLYNLSKRNLPFIHQVVEEHIHAGDVVGIYPIQFVKTMNAAQVHKIRPKHDISKAFQYWKYGLSDHPDRQFADKVFKCVEFGVEISYVGECVKTGPQCMNLQTKLINIWSIVLVLVLLKGL